MWVCANCNKTREAHLFYYICTSGGGQYLPRWEVTNKPFIIESKSDLLPYQAFEQNLAIIERMRDKTGDA